MNTIKIIKKNQPFISVDGSQILDKLSASDIPYYIILEEDSNSYIIRCVYIYGKEEKRTISIGDAHLSIGNISGKIYQYTTEPSNIISPLKFKDKVKEFNGYKNDARFKTNVNAFLILLNEIILQNNKTTLDNQGV